MTRSLARRAVHRLRTRSRACDTTSALLLAGCGVLSPDAREFTIQIDSVAGPTTVAPTSALPQLLYSPVGPAGCSSFSSLRIEATTTGADVTAIGVHKRGSCIQVPMYLTALPLTISPPLREPFVLRALRPRGTVISRVIQVR